MSRRLHSLPAALLSLAIPSAPGIAAEQPARISAPGRYSGYAAALYTDRVRSSRYVVARDGTRLAIDIYRPAVHGTPVATPYPVVWALTPYRRGFLDKGEVQLSGGLRQFDVRKLTDYGYVVAVADLRGKGASFGHRRGMADEHDGQDGYDITEWLAAQPWSSGKIGMTGCSYVGGTQDNIVQFRPPHLKAVFPGANVYNRYDFVARGGLTAQYHTRPEQPEFDQGAGSLPVDEDRDGSLLAAARAEHEANTPMPDTWRAIPYRDDWSPLLGSRFWEESSPSQRRNDVERSGVAIYKWASWQDEFSSEQFIAKANLRNPMKILMLPAEHCQLSGFDMFAEQHRFFDYWLKGIDNGIMAEPAIRYYTFNEPAGQEWHTTATWPLPEARERRLYLAPGVPAGKAGGTVGLVDRTPAAGLSRFAVDYSVLVDDGSTPSWIPSQDGHGLSFETAPFARDTEVTGHPVVHLWVASTATDGDVFAYLEEVAPDGKAVVRSHGRLRASHRALGTAPFEMMGLPWHRSFREDAAPLVPGQPVALDFDLLPTSTVVKAGMRLRLVVAGADARQRMRPPPGTPPTVSVYAGGDRASYISLPVVERR